MALLLVLLFGASLPAVTTRLYSSDEVQYFAYLRSLWFDQDVSFENEYRHFYDRGIAQSQGFHEAFLERTTPAGRRINFATIGSAILWAPFYGVADAITRLRAAAGSSVGQHRQREHLAIKLAHRSGTLVREAAEHVDLTDLGLRAVVAPEVRLDGCGRAALRRCVPRDPEQH